MKKARSCGLVRCLVLLTAGAVVAPALGQPVTIPPSGATQAESGRPLPSASPGRAVRIVAARSGDSGCRTV